MTLTRKGAREATAASTAKDILESNPKTVTISKKENQEDEILESKKCDKAIAEWIGQPFKPPSRNKDKEDEDKEEDFNAPLASTDDGSHGNKDDEGFEDNW